MKSASIQFCLLLSCLVLSSCSTGPQTSYSSTSWHPVSGKVTLDGKPLAGAFVQFTGDDKISSSAVTDASGDYKLSFDSQQSGATPGVKKVSIRTNYQVAESIGGESPAGAITESTKEKLPAKYHDETTLTANVVSGANDFNFDLTSK